MPKNKIPKKNSVKQQGQQIICNVYNYLKDKNLKTDIISTVADATKISRSTVEQIVKENGIAISTQRVTTPVLQRTMTVEEALNKTVLHFQQINEKPTISRLYKSFQEYETYHVHGNLALFRKLLKMYKHSENDICIPDPTMILSSSNAQNSAEKVKKVFTELAVKPITVEEALKQTVIYFEQLDQKPTIKTLRAKFKEYKTYHVHGNLTLFRTLLTMYGYSEAHICCSENEDISSHSKRSSRNMSGNDEDMEQVIDKEVDTYPDVPCRIKLETTDDAEYKANPVCVDIENNILKKKELKDEEEFETMIKVEILEDDIKSEDE